MYNVSKSRLSSARTYEHTDGKSLLISLAKFGKLFAGASSRSVLERMYGFLGVLGVMGDVLGVC